MNIKILLALLVIWPALTGPGAAGTGAPLQQSLEGAVAETLAEFARCGKPAHAHSAECRLQSNQLAVTFMVLREGAKPDQASFRGTVPIYPASVVKLFYLAAAHRWMEDGKIQDSPELRRALRDMIVESYNEATHYVVDLVTGTTGGPELPEAEMREWAHKRNAVNRYFAGLGYSGVNINQKPWGEGPYGRERVFVGRQYENRNQLTTDATARLLGEIALGRCVTPERSRQMLELLRRDPSKPGDSQATEYVGAALPKDARLWCKAGWTSTTRHDAAYVELPDGRQLVIVIFTTNHTDEAAIIPSLARRLLALPR